MFFDSLAYLLFVPLVWLFYQVTPDHRRWLVLLAGSVIFYAALEAPELLAVWAIVVLVSYYLGFAISRSEDEGQRRRRLWVGIVANIGILCVVKYRRELMGVWEPRLAETGLQNLLVTVGISYYTIQAISYLIDLYTETVEPEPHLGLFALYLGFFPKMLQGPIERAGDLLPQLRAPYECRYDDLRSGLLLFTWGMFKKVAVANRLAVYVNLVYGDLHAYGGITLILATYMYAFQILADFSGYTDMALGVARLFGIRLTENFKAPYLATSVADFWRRWHISFSRWILDYVFKPLQLEWRNLRTLGTAAALLVTFLFSGLWHGVSWNFLVWGLLHGLFLAASVFYKPLQKRIYARLRLQNHPLQRVIQTAITFNLVTFTWIFFRAASLSDAWYVVTHLTSGLGTYVVAVLTHLNELTHLKYLWDPILMEQGLPKFVLLAISLGTLVLGSLAKGRIKLPQRPVFRWSLYYALILAISYLAIYSQAGFVYFQF